MPGPEEQEVASQILPRAASTEGLQQLLTGVNATCPASLGDAELVFMAELPPLGYSTFFVRPSASKAADCLTGVPGKDAMPNPADSSRFITVGSGVVSLDFDKKTGMRRVHAWPGWSSSIFILAGAPHLQGCLPRPRQMVWRPS